MIELTDQQIVRVFQLCERIGRVQHQVPPLPDGYARNETAQLERAKSLRGSLELENDSLVELGALLR